VGDEEILGSVLYCPYDYSPLPAPRAKTVLYTPERGRIFLIVSGALAIFLILALLLFFLWPEVRDGQPGSTNIKPPMQPIQKPVQPESKTASSGSASGRTSTPDTTAIQHPPAETAKLSPKSAEVHPEDRQGTPSRATSESSDANPGSKSQSEPKSETSVASATLPPKLPQDSGKHPTKTTQQSELESPPLQPPQPPVPAAVHSGVLHYQGPPVPYNGVVVFDHLPQARLKFNFDRQAWTLLIKPNPDGTKRVTMISQKQGYQTNCDLNWEIVE
jgi:hypothetical protein